MRAESWRSWSLQEKNTPNLHRGTPESLLKTETCMQRMNCHEAGEDPRVSHELTSSQSSHRFVIHLITARVITGDSALGIFSKDHLSPLCERLHLRVFQESNGYCRPTITKLKNKPRKDETDLHASKMMTPSKTEPSTY